MALTLRLRGQVALIRRGDRSIGGEINRAAGERRGGSGDDLAARARNSQKLIRFKQGRHAGDVTGATLRGRSATAWASWQTRRSHEQRRCRSAGAEYSDNGWRALLE
jgi:hypothetical protein